uniref:PH domain-containing protein n=1 Tax=Plectus sambesii TaxID=2011161 RepID=A0A914VRH8_9BILA
MERKTCLLTRSSFAVMFCISSPELKECEAMPDANGEQGTIVHQGWLLKSREPLMKLPFIKSKWVKRYFVLRSGTPSSPCRLDQYHDEKMRKRTKSLNLEQCSQVDSYLRMTHADRHKEWIFAMHLNKREVYLAADNEEQMNKWVTDLCHVCNLERQESNSPINYEDVYQDEPGVSFDSLQSTPMTEEQNIHNMFAERNNDDDEEREERLCAFEFPAVQKSLGNVGANDAMEPYLHINSFSSSSAAQSVGQQGYVHLTQCISAQPRPNARGPAKGTAATSGALTLPLAPPVPVPAPVHQRGPSSDSTASSQRSISVSDNESSSQNTPSLEIPANLDTVPPPPRPPKVTAQVHTPNHSYSNAQPKKTLPGYDVPTPSISHLNQRPPPPAPTEEEGSSAETIKSPTEYADNGDSYMNLPISAKEKLSPAPTVDRSKKPSRSARPAESGESSDKDDNSPLKPTAVRINRIDSFVRKGLSPAPTPQGTPQSTPQSQQHERPRVPAQLPITNPRPRMTAAQIVNSSAASPNPARPPGTAPLLEYIDPTFMAQPSPRSARAASPRTGGAPTDSFNLFSSPSKSATVNYAVINEKATKAVEETISQPRTLDRKKY